MFKFMKKNITFLPGESKKTKINYRNIINKLPKGMIIAVFDKFKLNSIANKQENILQKK